MVACGKTPLLPWRELDQGPQNIFLGIAKLILTTVTSIASIATCVHTWEFAALAAMKLSLSLTYGLISIFHAKQISLLYLPGAIAGLTGSFSIAASTMSEPAMKLVTGLFWGLAGMTSATIILAGCTWGRGQYTPAAVLVEKVHNLLFHTEDPYSDASWSIPLLITNPGGSNHIDPDLFWEDGTAYMATGWGRIFLSVIDVNTGNASGKVEIWKGTGGNNPEAPHIYKKDGFFYLLIAEGGAGLGHSATIARSPDLYGPYESYLGIPFSPIEDRASSFNQSDMQTCFEMLTTTGPELENYPMGRETVLTAVTWENDSWPVFDPVRGTMHGPLPRTTASPHKRLLIDTGDEVNFNPGTSLPHHFVHFRSKVEEKYTIINSSLRLLPSRSNLTGSTDHFDPEDGVTFVGLKQTATKFSFSVDLSFVPKNFGDEAGISIFHSQQQHIDLSVVLLEDSDNPQLRMAATTYGRPSAPVPETVLQSVPRAWVTCPIRLSVEALDTNDYKFVASSTCNRVNASIDMGMVSSDVTSGGFLGAYS
ncbi:xylosidase arabinofuranosidase [Colletotrichum chrysophilum]|uniref:Xylosidase arabinofuranosidase n=1 Tax=Colletotrichum chrysophilum TaxID=1836956 RepID=A0AAD9A9G2_9PEZI|nr:xylosidase arabinofuranosidase [Colletotrichum chrysophilum]